MIRYICKLYKNGFGSSPKMQIGGDNSWCFVHTQKFTISHIANVHRAKISFLCSLLQFFAINQSKLDVVNMVLLLLCMSFIGTCSKVILFPIIN